MSWFTFVAPPIGRMMKKEKKTDIFFKWLSWDSHQRYVSVRKLGNAFLTLKRRSVVRSHQYRVSHNSISIELHQRSCTSFVTAIGISIKTNLAFLLCPFLAWKSISFSSSSIYCVECRNWCLYWLSYQHRKLVPTLEIFVKEEKFDKSDKATIKLLILNRK